MRISILSLVIFLASCSNASLEQELKDAQDRLAAVEAEFAASKAVNKPDAPLVHMVFFDLKPEADQEALLAEIRKLAEIPVLEELEVGPFKNLEDNRALSEYELVMQMSFANAEAYQTYQQHPIHLALKEKAASFMAGPPATYDFMKK